MREDFLQTFFLAHRLRALSIFIFFLLIPGSASAFPFLGLRVGGTPFEGPVDWESTAMWWNPAALSLMRGLQINLTATADVARGEIARTPIRGDTGIPGAGADRIFPKQGISRDTFSGFGAIAWNYNENVTIALGAFAPWVSCPAGSICPHAAEGGNVSLDLPSSYHMVSESWTHLYVTFAGAFRLTSRLHFGIALSLIDSFADMTFYHDGALDQGSAAVAQPSALCGGQPCGYENPQAAQRIHASGNGGVFWKTASTPGIPSPTGIATNFGIVASPVDRVWLGFSYQHAFAAFSKSSGYSSSGASGSQVTPAPGSGNLCGGQPCSGGATLFYNIPDVWHLGVKVALTPALELESWVRVVTYGNYGSNNPVDRGLVVQLNGAATRGGAPTRIIFNYGLQPAFAGEVGLRWRPHHAVRLGLSLAGETSAVQSNMVSAAALDAPKFDFMLGLEWRVVKKLRFIASYGFTALFFPEVNPGGDDPGATVRCTDARYSLDACGAALAGSGLPSNAGSYSLLTHHFAFSGVLDL